MHGRVLEETKTRKYAESLDRLNLNFEPGKLKHVDPQRGSAFRVRVRLELGSRLIYGKLHYHLGVANQ